MLCLHYVTPPPLPPPLPLPLPPRLPVSQANRYSVYDEQGNVVALLAEEEGSLGRALGRQLLRTRRPFTATVFSPDGQVIFTLRRPFYLINSRWVGGWVGGWWVGGLGRSW